MKSMDHKTIAFVLTVSLLLAAGCSRESRMQKALASAQTQARERNYAAAEIEYLRVLQLNPQQSEALAGLGGVYYAQGRWSLAVPLLVEAVRIAPDNLEARLKAATLYLGAGNGAEAQTHAEFILSREPTNAEAVLILADASFITKQAAAARQHLQTLRASAGDQAVFHCAEAVFLMNLGDDTNAELEARKAVEMDPQFDVGYLILGDLLLRQGREAESRASFETGYSLADSRSRRKFRWIDVLRQQGEIETAQLLLDQLGEAAPDYFPVMLRQARLKLQLGELGECEEWLDKALALDAGSFEAMSLRCELLLQQGRTDQAVQALERMVKVAPQSASLSFQLAKAYVRAGSSSAAMTQISRTIELNSSWVEPRLLRVEMALRMGDTSGALVWIDELLRVAPESRAARFLEAEARRLSGSYDQASLIYRRLLEKAPNDAESLFRLGQIRFLQNKPREARALFEAAVESNPSHLPSLSALADMDFKDQNLSVAIQRVQNLLEKNPLALGPKFLLAQIYLAQGSQGEAADELNGIIDLAPTWRPPYMILARQYVDSDEVDSARSRLALLLSNLPDDERAMAMLGALDEAQANYSAAAERYEALLKAHPASILAMNNLAYLYSTHLPDLDRAFKLASAAREMQPRDASIADTFGWVLIKRGEYRRALGILREFEARLSRSPESSYHLGLAHYLTGIEPPAKVYLAAAVESGQEFFGREEARTQLAVLNVDPVTADAQARLILEQALQENAADPVALMRLAAIHRLQGDAGRERELYDAALNVDPSSLPALIGLAQLFSASAEGQARALELARSARLLAPKDPEVAYTLGKLAFRAGDYSWALSLLEECSVQWPDRPDLLRDLGLAYYSMGRLAEAEQTTRKLANQTAVNREEARKFLELLARHRSLGDPDQAKQLAESVLQQEPGNAAALMVRGLVAEQAGNAAEALASYEAVMGMYPAFAPAMKRIAVLAAGDLKDDSKAYTYGIKAREYYPDDAELSKALGEVMYRRGDYGYARQLLKEASVKGEEDVDLIYYLGLAQYQTRDIQAARQTLTRALQLSPGHALAAQARQALDSM